MKARKIILIILFSISFVSFTYSLLNIAKWFKDNDSTNKVVEKINEIADVKEIEDTENHRGNFGVLRNGVLEA